MKKKFIARQGDVFVLRVDDLDESELALKPVSASAGGIQIAEGESSGHTHRLFGRGSKLFSFRDTARQERVIVVGKSGADLRVVGGGSGGVDRHTPISLAPGKYLVRTQRSWSLADERAHAVQD